MAKKITIEKVVAKICKKYNLYCTPHGAFYMKQKAVSGAKPLLVNAENIGYVAYQLTQFIFQTQQIEIIRKMIKEHASDLGNIRDVYTRIGIYKGAIYVDLGRNGIAKITEEDINIVRSSPVLFYRPPGMLDLPEPIFGKTHLQAH